MKVKRLLTKTIMVLVVAALLLGVPMTSGMLADLFDYGAIDPDGAFAWISVHHIVQAAIFLLIIALLRRHTSLEFGLTWGDRERGKKYVTLFMVGFTVYTVLFYSLIILTNSLQPFDYPLTAGNVIGQLGFQFLLSGPSEELIFRAFAITMLSTFFAGRVLKGKISVANLVAAIIFGLAHVQFLLIPFAAVYDPAQVVYAIGLGLIYGDCYEKTDSVIYPMIMHSFTNVLMVSVQIITTYQLV